jgi:hypothetical protein
LEWQADSSPGDLARVSKNFPSSLQTTMPSSIAPDLPLGGKTKETLVLTYR